MWQNVLEMEETKLMVEKSVDFAETGEEDRGERSVDLGCWISELLAVNCCDPSISHRAGASGQHGLQKPSRSKTNKRVTTTRQYCTGPICVTVTAMLF